MKKRVKRISSKTARSIKKSSLDSNAFKRKLLELSKTESIAANVPEMNALPTRSNTNDSQVNNNAQGKVQNSLPNQIADLGFVFKVQIGAFKEEVPIEIANKFLKITSKGIKNFMDENGLTVYTAGNFDNYENANELKNEILNIGVIDAFVIAFNGGKKISMEEVQKFIKK